MAILALLASSAVAAHENALLEERLLTAYSNDDVAITATFDGHEIFVYGAVTRNRFLTDRDTPPEVIITITGPSTPLMVRKKDRIGGIWLNAEAVRIGAAPSFYAVMATRPLTDILDPADDNSFRISLDKVVSFVGMPFSARDPEEFRQAVLRLRSNAGLYFTQPRGVRLRNGTLFESRVTLPPNLVEGDYEARVFLVRDRRVRDQVSTPISVRKAGIERATYRLAHEQPLLYGLLTLLAALAAGWGANELFRRLRR